MAKLTRFTAGSSRELLARILERSELVAAVEKLSPPVLGQLIEHVGLEDAGELVAAASMRQLERVWDRDLWTRPEGESQERFDPERFGTWLAVMLEAGEAQLAQRLCELPFELLTLAVHRLVRVLDREMWKLRDEHGLDDDDDGAPYAPWHELVLIARDENSWDAVFTALLALDEADHALLRRVLERCCDLEGEWNEWDEDGGETRSEDAVLERDVAAERDTRQSGGGYVSASDASAFLRLAQEEGTDGVRAMERDAVTSAYFRELVWESDDERAGGHASANEAADEHMRPSEEGKGHGTLSLREAEKGLAELLGVLAESGVLDAQPTGAVAALTAGTADGAGQQPATGEAESLLQLALRELAGAEWRRWSERMEELGYLANVLLAVCREHGRELAPRAALEAATAVSSLGLELQLSESGSARDADALEVVREVSADRLFRAGYAKLHRELVQEAWRVLQQKVGRYGDAELRSRFAAALKARELGALAGELDGEQLRVRQERLEAVCGLAQAIPLLAGSLAVPSARYVTTRVQLQAGKRLLRSLSARRASGLPRTGS